MKVAICVIVYNLNSRVFILQMEAIKMLCTDEDYTIEVVNNSDNQELSDSIKHQAGVHGVSYREVVSGTKDPSHSHAFAANFAYQKIKDQYDAILFLDHDAIPIQKFSVIEMLGGKYIGGVLSGRELNYFWPGCVCIDNSRIDKDLVDFSPNNDLRLDTGGELRHLKEKYGDEGCRYFDEVGAQNEAMMHHKHYYFYMLIYNKTFLHFLAGSNWPNSEQHEKRINSLINITQTKISENVVRLQ
jgi:hypothetical protein